MKKVHLEVIGWILFAGFIGCFFCASLASLEPHQYKATVAATIVFGITSTTCLIISQRNKNSKLTTRV